MATISRRQQKNRGRKDFAKVAISNKVMSFSYKDLITTFLYRWANNICDNEPYCLCIGTASFRMTVSRFVMLV
jgi:hypothetical protein